MREGSEQFRNNFREYSWRAGGWRESATRHLLHGGQAGFKAWPCLHMSDIIIEFILTLYVIPRVRFREHSILLSFSGRFWSLVADS